MIRGKLYLKRFEVQRLLGEGGMGRVYLCKDISLNNRPVVLKVMHDHIAKDPKFGERFKQEMSAMSRFAHPYAVMLFDFQNDPEDGPCIIMEYVRGETLATVLKREGRLLAPRVGRLLGQICEVLQEAHNIGLIHRDLKPSNLMVLDAGSPREKIKVMDFGLAKTSQMAKEMADAENKEFMVGTPAYMSPEQARGEEIDHRSDIYSLGVILYELLTGRLPFPGLNTMDAMLAHAIDAPPPMSTEEAWVAPAIERVVMQCLAKNSTDRPSSAAELFQEFDLALRASDPGEYPQEAPPDEAGAGDEPPMPEDLTDDPSAAVYQMQAWLPEAVAQYKLQSFFQDVKGQVVESLPGMIRVLLGGKGSPYEIRRGWFGLGGGRPWLEMQLQLFQGTGKRQNNLWVTVIFKSQERNVTGDFRPRCDQIFRDLRGYLIGTSKQQ
jgi:serine/threonine-protein kinase